MFAVVFMFLVKNSNFYNSTIISYMLSYKIQIKNIDISSCKVARYENNEYTGRLSVIINQQAYSNS